MPAPWSLLCLPALCCTSAAPAWEAPPPKAVITIKPTDNPMEMAAVKALLKSDPGRLSGEKAWQPPAGDPSKITKADYLETLKANLPYCETAYGKEPTRPKPYAYEAIPIFAAFYKATGEAKYLKLLVNTYKEFCAAVDKEVKDGEAEMAKAANGRPGIGRYWAYCYAYAVVPLEAFEGTPEHRRVTVMLGKALGARAQAWPLYWEAGPHNRPIFAAFWYDTALKYNPAIPRAAELKAYCEAIWNDWWSHRDVEEDCPGYTSTDLLVLDPWAVVRGVAWWKDKDAPNLWRHYAHQIANDGTYPAYGDAGVVGNFFVALRVAETVASRCKDGRAKWFAHRAFFNGRDRIRQMCAGIGAMNYVELAMAYLYADDSVREVAPQAGLEISRRRYRLVNNFNNLGPRPVFFNLEDRWAPSKLIFRSGPKETDPFMLVQAAGQAGHGQPDVGNIIQYSGDYAFYLCHGVTRLDHDMEQHNMFVVRDPVKDKPWRAVFTGEDYGVPASGQTAEGAYARIHVQEAPGVNVAESWKKVLAWRGGYPPHRACGYKNWPVRLDRSVLFINNRFAVVRDVMTPTLPVKAQIGQNWVFGHLGPAIGRNWVNVRTRNPLSGYYYFTPGSKHFLAPIYTAQRDLLIWFAPRSDGMMQVVDGPDRSWYGNYFINLTRRVWYPRTGDWRPGQAQAFTTVLLPHDPKVDPVALAASITTVKDSVNCTVLKVTNGDTARLIVLNTSGTSVTVGALVTDAEAAMLTTVNGKPSHLSAWHATRASVAGKALHRSGKAVDVDRDL